MPLVPLVLVILIALPGHDLPAFKKERQGLVVTGGLAVPGIKPGYSFQVWEDHLGTEYQFGPNLMPCDPSDMNGVSYLPKTSLLVQKSPDGRSTVVADKYAFMVHSDAEVQEILKREEAFIRENQTKPKGFVERFKRWFSRNIKKEPELQTVFDDGRVTITKGKAFDGRMIELILSPVFEVFEDEASDSAPVPATSSVKAAMKIIRYLAPYEKVALEDLVGYADGKPKKPRKRQYHGH